MKQGKKEQEHQRLKFTYIADELGHIVETRPSLSGMDPSFDVILPPLRKPMMPIFIDTPEKKAMWLSYWDNIEGWWSQERDNERRKNW